MNLFEIAPSPPASDVAIARSRLDAAEKAAIETASHPDLVTIYQELAIAGDGSAARVELYYFNLTNEEDTVVRRHFNAIESAWHALQQAERKALRFLKP